MMISFAFQYNGNSVEEQKINFEKWINFRPKQSLLVGFTLGCEVTRLEVHFRKRDADNRIEVAYGTQEM